jgi:PhnB protein
MQVKPYLSFNGRCEEAFEFYKQAVGAEVVALWRFRDAPPGSGAEPEMGDKVMHASLRIGDSYIMASDGRCEPDAKLCGFSLSLGVTSVEEGERIFAALGKDGSVTMPFAPTFWAPGFGMLVDQFGVSWMVNVDTQ